MRKNGKQQVFSEENAIQKSNELSMAKLSQGLTLNQMQLLAYAIYCTQKNGKTEFIKADFEKQFEIEKYQTKHAKEDVPKVSRLQFSLVDLEKDIVDYLNIFQRIRYEDGLFTFKWSDDIVPHILKLKDKFVSTDLTITSQFRSSFSWTLYDYLRAHYGYWHKPLSKEALMKLFGVESKKTYQKNTGDFRKTVLDIAIAEINKVTELDVRYEVEKKGRSIVGFDLIWSSGTNLNSATKKQIKELQRIINIIHEDMFDYINLNDEKMRSEAILLVRKTENMHQYTKEPICITKEYADRLIRDADHSLKKLEKLLEADKTGRIDLYYDWLNE